MEIDSRSEECLTDQCSNVEELRFSLFVDRLNETNVPVLTRPVLVTNFSYL